MEEQIIAAPTTRSLKNTSQMQMQVGVTILQTTPVTLAWSSDDIISLTDNLSGEIIFSTAPGGIKKVSAFNGQMAIDLVDGKHINLIFDTNALANMVRSTVAGQAGLIGIPLEIKAEIGRVKDEESSGVKWWINNFKSHNVRTSFTSQKKSWITALIIAAVVLTIIFATGVPLK